MIESTSAIHTAASRARVYPLGSASAQTRLGLAVQRTLLRVATAPGVREVLAKVAAPGADEVRLPAYRFGSGG